VRAMTVSMDEEQYEQVIADFRKRRIEQVEQLEDMLRLASIKKDGGIPHDEIMDWLENLAAGKSV